MKNIFKLMSVAVLAASMIFVSCKKDENNDEPANNIPDGINVTFNGTSWTAGENSSVYHSAYSALQLSCAKTTSSEFPIFDEVIYTAEVGTTTETVVDGQFESNGVHGYVEYYEQTYLTDGTNYYGDWWGEQATTDIKAIDLNALTITAVCEGTMFSALEALVQNYEGYTGYADATRAPYKVTFGNAKLSAN